MRLYLLILLFIGSVPLCLAQDIRTHIDVRVRECRAPDKGCRWSQPGRMVLQFVAVGERSVDSRAQTVRRGGRAAVDLKPGRYIVRPFPPGKVVVPDVVDVAHVRRSIVVTSYPAPVEDVGEVGGGAGPSRCRATGCNGELCAGTEVPSACNWTPVFRCLSARHCVATSNGTCEWRDLRSITRCMEKKLNEGTGEFSRTFEIAR